MKTEVALKLAADSISQTGEDKYNSANVKLRIPKFEKENPEHKLYFETVARLTARSDVLTNNFVGNPSVYTRIFDKSGIVSYFLELTGNSKGFYDKGGEAFPATIPMLRGKLLDISKKFEQYKREKINEGKAKPTEMPTAMAEKQMVLFARLFVRTAEANELQSRMAKLARSEAKTHNENMLIRGPQGISKLNHGICSMMDGQVCRKIGDIVIITEPESPYCGMATADYLQHIFKPYRAAIMTEHLKDMAKYNAAVANGEKVSVPTPFKGGKSDLPEWPANVQKHKI